MAERTARSWVWNWAAWAHWGSARFQGDPERPLPSLPPDKHTLGFAGFWCQPKSLSLHCHLPLLGMESFWLACPGHGGLHRAEWQEHFGPTHTTTHTPHMHTHTPYTSHAYSPLTPHTRHSFSRPHTHTRKESRTVAAAHPLSGSSSQPLLTPAPPHTHLCADGENRPSGMTPSPPFSPDTHTSGLCLYPNILPAAFPDPPTHTPGPAPPAPVCCSLASQGPLPRLSSLLVCPVSSSPILLPWALHGLNLPN